MKHAVASRLAKAGIAAPAAAGLLWIADKIKGVLSVRSADFMPHGYCYLWDPHIVWLNVISDGLITLSYYCIPVVLIYFIRKRRDLPFNWIFWMFGGFILACGTTHLLEVWNIWHASYLFAGIVKAITATISVATAILLIPLVPQAVAVPNLIHLQEKNRRLEEQIAKRQRLDAAVADAPLRRWVSSGTVLAVFLIVLLGFLSWRSRQSSSAEADLVARTYAVMHGLEAALQHVTEAGTSARGFAFSGNAILLAHYQASKDTLPHDVEALRKSTADNPSQQRRIDLLDPQIGVALRFAEQMVTNRLQRNEAPTASEVLETEKLMEAVHGTVLAMQAEESELLSQRTRKTVTGRRRTDLITIAGTFAGVIFLVVAGAAIHRETDISARARTQLRILNTELEERVEQRTAALESEIAERKNANDALERSLATSERAQAALRESEERLRLFVEHAPAALAMFDREMRYQQVSRRWLADYGLAGRDVIGISHYEIFSEVPERWKVIHRRSMAGEVLRGDNDCFERADGTEQWLKWEVRPWYGTTGEIGGIVIFAEDITENKRAEEARQVSEQRYRRFVERTAAGVLRNTLDGRILESNDAMVRMLGYDSRAEFLARPTPEIHYVDPEERGHLIELLERNQALNNHEVCFKRKDGSPVWVVMSLVLVKDEDEAGDVIEATVIDVTARKDAEHQLAKQADQLYLQSKELILSQQALEAQTLMLQSVLDSMAEGLVAADEQGKFTIWNPAAARLVGMGAENVPPGEWNSHYGCYLPDTVTPLPPEQNPLLRAIRGEAGTAEMFVRNAELDHGTWIEATGSPLKDKSGTVRGGVVAFRDISQRKADEREIRQLNEELEERVAQRTEQLEAANHELEAFTYSVSHDLRAPLRHIGGFSRILLEDFGPKMEPEALSHLHRIEDGTRRMGLLVDELLNLARVGRHTLKLEAIPLNPIIEEIISVLQPEVNGRVVEWRIAQLPSAMCDPVLVKQVFQNLLANALKFTRPRERAVIEIGHRQESGQILLFVRDNGVGFSMKYQDKLFGVFQRLHRAEDFEGTGIGLATVKRIVNKHGGRVWANSELDKGATFYFTLGAAKPAGVMPAEMVPRGTENKTTLAGA